MTSAWLTNIGISRKGEPETARYRQCILLLVALAVVAGYFYGWPKYRALKKDCIESGMDHSDHPSDNDLDALWMTCRKIGYGPRL